MMDTGDIQSPDALAQPIYTITFLVENYSDEPIKLICEPWGYYYDLLPKEFVRVVARGPQSGCPVFYRAGLDFVYSAWARSVYAIYKSDKLVSWSLDDCPPEPSPILMDKLALETLRILKDG
jgi:hypothetical protein